MQELEGSNLDCAMAQHLLVAADRFQLPRLRRICERRLCETVEVLIVARMPCCGSGCMTVSNIDKLQSRVRCILEVSMTPSPKCLCQVADNRYAAPTSTAVSSISAF